MQPDVSLVDPLEYNLATCTGEFFIDDDVLAQEGITDFSAYGPDVSQLVPDLFLD